MANEVKLECYSIKVRRKNSNEGMLLNKIIPLENGPSEDILDFASAFFQKEKKKFHDIKEDLKAFEIKESNFSKENRIITGIIESGDYGLTSIIRDIISGEERFKKKETDTDQKPFYYLMYLPKQKALGFLILQRTGIYGINHIFRSVFNTEFKNKYPELMIELAPVVSKNLAKLFLDEGGIKEILIRNYKSASDITEKLGLKSLEEDVLEVKIIISAKQKKFFKLNTSVKKFISNPDVKLFNFNNLAKLGFDDNSTYSIKVKHGGNYRTIDLTDTANIAPYYDIDKEVQKKSGHPIFHSIDSIAKDLISEIEEELYN